MKEVAYFFRITGKVQRVFFRAETQKKAQELGLHGWVRNCNDGSVEVHAEGDKTLLQTLQEWLYLGPPMAQVENVESKEVKPEGYTSFEIQSTI